MAKAEVMPSIEEEFKSAVDEMIKNELENMRLLWNIKKKKPRKVKPKRTKVKKVKLPGWKAVAKYDIKDLLVELVQNRIAKKLPAQSLTDFIGEFNYLHSMLDDIKDTPYDPSMALIR